MTELQTRPKRSLHRPHVGARAKLPLLVLFSLLTGLGLSLAGTLIATQSLHKTLDALLQAPLPILAAALFLALVTLFLTGVTRSLFAGGSITALLMLALSYVNYFKNLITATPLLPEDLGLAGNVGDIAELNGASISFSRNSILALAAVVLGLAVLFYFSRPLRVRWRASLPAALCAAALFAVLFAVRPVVNTLFYTPRNVPLGSNYSQAYVNGQTGVLMGFWRAVIGGGEDYDLTEADEDSVLADAQGYIDEIPVGGTSDTQPNVIMILSESFFDVTKLPGVTYEEDPLADFHAAQETGVSGTFHTRTLGYGTCNIELEMLTGINTRYLAADESLCYWDGTAFDGFPSVPGLFAENGYYTAYVHTFNDEIYHRTPIYTHLGFQDLFFSGDFAQIDPEAAAAGDYWAYMQGKIAGEFYSDDYLADVLIDLCEEKSGEQPVFLFGVTMENHTPYPADKYSSYGYPFTAAISDEAAGALNAYTQGAADSSAALGKLIDHFSQSDEPTVIIFFGDHRAGLPLEEGGTVYSALGMCSESSSDWTPEQVAELYSTDYVIWSNDAALLPAEPGSTVDSSSSYLGLDALRAADLPLNSYWRMIAAMRQRCEAYTWSYFLSADGAVSSGLPDDLSDAVRRQFDVMTWLMRDAVSVNGTAVFDTLG